MISTYNASTGEICVIAVCHQPKQLTPSILMQLKGYIGLKNTLIVSRIILIRTSLLVFHSNSPAIMPAIVVNQFPLFPAYTEYWWWLIVLISSGSITGKLSNEYIQVLKSLVVELVVRCISTPEYQLARRSGLFSVYTIFWNHLYIQILFKTK